MDAHRRCPLRAGRRWPERAEKRASGATRETSDAGQVEVDVVAGLRLGPEAQHEQVPGVLDRRSPAGSRMRPSRRQVRQPLEYRAAIAARAVLSSAARASWTSPIAAARSVRLSLNPAASIS